MRITEFYFKSESIDILEKHIDSKGLRAVYNLNVNTKYTIDYIVDVVLQISNKSYTRYKLPLDLCTYLNQSQYSKYSRTSIKNFVRDLTFTGSENNSIFNTYVIIGHDIPVNIKQLNVIVEDDVQPVFTDV